jgi:hypothetical protein
MDINRSTRATAAGEIQIDADPQALRIGIGNPGTTVWFDMRRA